MNIKFNKHIFILGIESSCDDTSIGVSRNMSVLSNIVSNQKIHKKYGGVVPELASREHQKNIIPTLQEALKSSKISLREIDAIAFTNGPGLLGSLLVGASFAKSLSISLKKPLIAINHMEAHVLANFIGQKPQFPLICLTVSGGHTQLVMVESPYSMYLIGETLDDSAGETFDKCAKILGLPYPGGPQIEKYAKGGDKNKFKFSIPKVKSLDFSFSGLKTNIKRLIEENSNKSKNFITNERRNLCASIENIIIKILIDKLTKAIDKFKVSSIAISGGVSANEYFRNEINKLKNKKKLNAFIPDKQYSTDNGAMIAVAGYYKFINEDFTNLDIAVKSRLKIGEI